MEPLNALDASFVDAEDQDRQTSFAIGSIAIFEGPAPSYEEFLAAIGRRLPLVPLYRRKLRKIPLNLGSPVWVDDPNFDLRYHVRQTALPAPGGEEELRRLMARVMSVALRQAADALRGMARMAGALWPAPGSSLIGPIGQQRRYAWARASVDDVKTIKRELGGTVNDVFLAAISSGFRALLLARGEEPTPSMVPSLVPVSVRNAGEESIYENRVSALVANLPVHLADPVERLAAVRTQLSELKASKESAAGEAVVSMGSLIPFPLASMFVRLAFSLPQREIVTVTTNVPGPQQPLYGLGRRLVEIVPYVPIATTLRTGVSIFTYCGNVTFGITGDYATTPDIAVLARGIEDGVAELLAAARSRSPKERPGKPGRSKAAAAKHPPAVRQSDSRPPVHVSPAPRASRAGSARSAGR